MADAIDNAAGIVAGSMSPPREGSEAGYGIAWETILATILPLAIEKIMGMCSRPPDVIVELSRSDSQEVLDLVYRQARAAVASQFSWFGRLLYSRQISKAARGLTVALLRTAADKLTVETAAELRAAARMRSARG